MYGSTSKLFINEENFIKWAIEPQPRSTPSFETFINRAKVRTGNGSVLSLNDYMKGKKITVDVLRAIYNFIINKKEYLQRFYNTSMKVADLHFGGDVAAASAGAIEPPMKLRELDNNKKSKYKNVIRNMHYDHILEKTKSGIKGLPSYFTVLNELLTQFIIDYKILTPSSGFYICNGRMGSVLSSLYFRSSIMNPYMVYSLNKSYLHAKRVFTPTLGWTSYMYGFLESGVEEYIGTDVIPSVCNKTRKFGETFYPDKTIEIYCKPSEDLLNINAFSRKYRAYFDTVFFSPPYYDMETYSGDKQSVRKYPTYELWLEKYWKKTIELCKYVLGPGGKMVYIISDYGEYNLIKDLNQITSSIGFRLIKKEKMYNKNVHVTDHRETGEFIFIFSAAAGG